MNANLAQSQQAFLAALRNGDESHARAVVDQVQATGAEPSSIYFDIFAPSMVTIGELWEQNQLSVAEEHLATSITERLIGQLSPSFNQPAAHGKQGNVVLGCIEGERHALGLRMLSDLFRKQGWRVVYLGADVPQAEWVQLAGRFEANVVAISASARRHEPRIRDVIAALRTALPHVHIMVGGAAFSEDPQLWQRVGADLYHPDPLSAVAIATAQYALATPRPSSTPSETVDG